MSLNDDVTRLPDQGRPESTLVPGQPFGHYTILRELGSGGMGEVYEAEHQVLGTRYAIKLLNREIMEREDARERFRREARVMAQLQHPNIVKVDEFGETDGHTWLRMELIPGHSVDGKHYGSLSALLAEQPRLPEEQVVRYLREILTGLAHAHGKNLVHRDMKPANLLIDASGALKITDFGLVRLAGEEWMKSRMDLTVARSMNINSMATMAPGEAEGSTTRALLGTFEFMSPEQREGRDVDARSDLYTVGLMAFRMLTGKRNPGFEMPSEIVDGLTLPWDEWIKTSLREDPDRRHQSATAMLEALVGKALETTRPAVQISTASQPAAARPTNTADPEDDDEDTTDENPEAIHLPETLAGRWFGHGLPKPSHVPSFILWVFAVGALAFVNGLRGGDEAAPFIAMAGIPFIAIMVAILSRRPIAAALGGFLLQFLNVGFHNFGHYAGPDLIIIGIFGAVTAVLGFAAGGLRNLLSRPLTPRVERIELDSRRGAIRSYQISIVTVIFMAVLVAMDPDFSTINAFILAPGCAVAFGLLSRRVIQAGIVGGAAQAIVFVFILSSSQVGGPRDSLRFIALSCATVLGGSISAIIARTYARRSYQGR